MHHGACKVEFQPFNRSYSQLTFFNFLQSIIFQLWSSYSFISTKRGKQIAVACEKKEINQLRPPVHAIRPSTIEWSTSNERKTNRMYVRAACRAEYDTRPLWSSSQFDTEYNASLFCEHKQACNPTYIDYTYHVLTKKNTPFFNFQFAYTRIYK